MNAKRIISSIAIIIAACIGVATHYYYTVTKPKNMAKMALKAAEQTATARAKSALETIKQKIDKLKHKQ